MPRDTSYLTYLLEDVFAGIPGITTRPMFGSFGLYRHGKIFAILSDDVVYMKADDSLKAQYEGYGSVQFRYSSKGKVVSLPYWQLPDEILSDETKIIEWIDQSASIELHKMKR